MVKSGLHWPIPIAEIVVGSSLRVAGCVTILRDIRGWIHSVPILLHVHHDPPVLWNFAAIVAHFVQSSVAEAPLWESLSYLYSRVASV